MCARITLNHLPPITVLLNPFPRNSTFPRTFPCFPVRILFQHTYRAPTPFRLLFIKLTYETQLENVLAWGRLVSRKRNSFSI